MERRIPLPNSGAGKIVGYDRRMTESRARIHCLLCSIILLACATVAPAQTEPPKPPEQTQTQTQTQTRRPGLSEDAINNLSRRHPGYLGALAPENLSKKRPKPAFDVTGTWFVDLRRSFEDFKFGPPYPEFHEAGQQAMREAAEARKAGK